MQLGLLSALLAVVAVNGQGYYGGGGASYAAGPAAYARTDVNSARQHNGYGRPDTGEYVRETNYGRDGAYGGHAGRSVEYAKSYTCARKNSYGSYGSELQCGEGYERFSCDLRDSAHHGAAHLSVGHGAGYGASSYGAYGAVSSHNSYAEATPYGNGHGAHAARSHQSYSSYGDYPQGGGRYKRSASARQMRWRRSSPHHSSMLPSQGRYWRAKRHYQGRHKRDSGYGYDVSDNAYGDRHDDGYGDAYGSGYGDESYGHGASSYGHSGGDAYGRSSYGHEDSYGRGQSYGAAHGAHTASRSYGHGAGYGARSAHTATQSYGIGAGAGYGARAAHTSHHASSSYGSVTCYRGATPLSCESFGYGNDQFKCTESGEAHVAASTHGAAGHGIAGYGNAHAAGYGNAHASVGYGRGGSAYGAGASAYGARRGGNGYGAVTNHHSDTTYGNAGGYGRGGHVASTHTSTSYGAGAGGYGSPSAYGAHGASPYAPAVSSHGGAGYGAGAGSLAGHGGYTTSGHGPQNAYGSIKYGGTNSYSQGIPFGLKDVQTSAGTDDTNANKCKKECWIDRAGKQNCKIKCCNWQCPHLCIDNTCCNRKFPAPAGAAQAEVDANQDCKDSRESNKKKCHFSCYVKMENLDQEKGQYHVSETFGKYNNAQQQEVKDAFSTYANFYKEPEKYHLATSNVLSGHVVKATDEDFIDGYYYEK